jgi:hypothetical protein
MPLPLWRRSHRSRCSAAMRFWDISEKTETDITVFDPNRVIDKATFEQPLQYSGGSSSCLLMVFRW